MEISKDLQLSLANDHSIIKSVEVTYRNNEQVSGFVHKVQFLPFEIILCKHEVLRGENSDHLLDFDNALQITLKYHNGEIKVFD